MVFVQTSAAGGIREWFWKRAKIASVKIRWKVEKKEPGMISNGKGSYVIRLIGFGCLH